MDFASVTGVAIASIMKLCQKIVELQFAAQRPENFHLSNDTCQRNATSQTAIADQSITTWIFTARYILPVLGGALSTTGLGYIRVLQIGGILMLLSAVILSITVYLGWMCSQPVFCVLLWLLLPLVFALVHPNVMHAIFRWHVRSSMCTVVSAVYCGSAVIGECLGMLLPVLISKMGNHITLIGIAISVLFLSLSPTLKAESDCTMPTKARMIRYFKIFAALIIFVITVSDIRPVVYLTELKYYLNATGNREIDAQVWSPEVLRLISLTLTCIVVALVACTLPDQIPVQPRIQAGIFIKSMVSLSLMIVNLLLYEIVLNAVVIRVIYSTASVMDGIATGLTMVSAYELMDMMADRSTKPLVIGIVFTVLGIANVLGRLMLLAFSAYPSQNPVLRPQEGKRPLLFVYHLTILLLLILCSIYHQCISFRLASTMVLTGLMYPDPELETEQEESQPLLASNGNDFADEILGPPCSNAFNVQLS